VSSFIPDGPPGGIGYKAIEIKQAFLEDALAGYRSEQTPGTYQAQIIDLLAENGAAEIGMTRGKVDDRAAYQLRFTWSGVPVEIVQVALPTRTRTESARKQAERQALYHLLNEIRFELERRHFHPELPAFIPYMIAPTQAGPMAVWQMIKSAQQLALPSPKLDDVIEAVFEEVK
jgi:hypothetical protein